MHNDPAFGDPVVLSSDDEDDATQNDRAIVLYNPNRAQTGPGELVPVPEPGPDPQPIHFKPPQRVLPSVGAFTVQCANCFKWRLIPTKEKYEEIREHILERPFSCEVAKEWRPDISCDDPTDIEQDGSRLWAIDKPSIAQPPPGWERELRIRGEGSSKFADVYYIAPTGKRLRSMVEVQKYLLEHPEFSREGVTLSQFSFRIPKPLQEDYVRKRTPRLSAPTGDSNWGVPQPLEPTEVSPLSWAPLDPSSYQLSEPGFPAPYSQNGHGVDSLPARKKARVSSEQIYNSDTLHGHRRFTVKGPRPPPEGVYEY